MTISMLGFGGVAKATTGALELVHPPRVIVPYSRALKFEGRFVLERIGSGAQIRSGGMKIEFSPGSVPKFLVGAAQFYEYNEAGQIETGLFTLYPFRETPTGVTATILKKGVGGPGRTPPLGTLVLEKPTAAGEMEGTLELHGSGPFPVAFRELGEDEGYDRSPPARQVHEVAGSEPGWSADPTMAQGEYELVEPARDDTSGAAQLAPLISFVETLGRHEIRPTGGDLAVLRGEPPIAEANLELGSLTETFYLTELSRRGDRRVATVRGGSPSGPKVGRFTGTQGAAVLKGTLTAGGSHYQVSFERESR
ncbi:MAG TPA: hypothetical protein VHA76_06415 [Solirubrobacterales bacterium]|nr:hypothetical protein [Solirubrobacterales bacterium]